ncbi:SDR family NAD(P)-dependent oxidoreductase [Georgenia muralis]|uniref:3-oxoacyl-[acyl-carrier protein] reductase n=1 Tax=Georgenia muralis TaxID=154117 RepID=A0A3N4Z355_9MICO|nr:SDR family oxidoreductase [Georgenia muralis]RPF26274.1 3-oxoacyl-[acyl-carrier protein] reductase [Georgenia muralis]
MSAHSGAPAGGALAEKVVLVTGATGGIGSATARAAAQAGARVAVHHLRDGERAGALAAALPGEGHVVVEADVTDPGDVEAMVGAVVDRAGALDVLVNNAGIMENQPFLTMDLTAWRRTTAVDLDGVFLCSRHAGAVMWEGDGGVIVNVASQLAFKGAAGYAAYVAAKAGVVGLTRALAREIGPRVRVCAIAPGPVDSPMTAPYQDMAWIAERTAPLVAGRLADPAEVAAAIVFLASDAASLMHGQTLHANGGGVLA